MRMIGPFSLHEKISTEEYEILLDWDEAFDSRGLAITQIFESNGEPGSATTIMFTREEAKVLFKYLFGVLNYRPLPDEIS